MRPTTPSTHKMYTPMTSQHVDASVANKRASQPVLSREDIRFAPPTDKAPIRTSVLTRRVSSARPGSSGYQLSKEIGRRVSSIGGLFSSKRHSSVITASDSERIGLPSRDTHPTSSGAVSYNSDALISKFPTPPSHQGPSAFADSNPSSVAASPPASGGTKEQDLSGSLGPLSQQGFEHLDLMIATHPNRRVELEKLKGEFQKQQACNIKEISERIGDNVENLKHQLSVTAENEKTMRLRVESTELDLYKLSMADTEQNTEMQALRSHSKTQGNQITKLTRDFNKACTVSRDLAAQHRNLQHQLRDEIKAVDGLERENASLKAKLADYDSLKAFRDGFYAKNKQLVELLVENNIIGESEGVGKAAADVSGRQIAKNDDENEDLYSANA